MTYHPAVQKIKELLEQSNIIYKLFEHAPVRTSEEAIGQRPGYELKQGAKAIIARATMPDKEKRFVMAVFPANERLDTKKLIATLSAKKINFATQEESDQITGGVEFGGIPPFGNIFGLEVIVDPTLFNNEEIVFNCGDRSASIAMKSEEYKKVVNPHVADITVSA